jgi:hypothetical protein
MSGTKARSGQKYPKSSKVKEMNIQLKTGINPSSPRKKRCTMWV